MPTIKMEDSYIIKGLLNPKEAAAYLSSVLEDGDQEYFLVALRNIAIAHGGIAALAKKTKLSRTSLYRMLSGEGNPEFATLEKLLKAFGLKIAVTPIKKRAS